MGCRAIVKLNNELVAFTHWGGQPNNLGNDLVRFYTGWQDSFKHYDQKESFKLKKEFVLGVCLMHQVDSVKESSDFHIYEYNVKSDGVYARCISNNSGWVKLPEIYEFAFIDVNKFVKNGGNLR